MVKNNFLYSSDLSYATGYIVLQRAYIYSRQPSVNELMKKHSNKDFDLAFGRMTGKSMRSAAAGSLVGIGEIFLLPLDVLKIKNHTNPKTFKGRHFIEILKKEIKVPSISKENEVGLRLGNTPSSFALFGDNVVAKKIYILGLQDY